MNDNDNTLPEMVRVLVGNKSDDKSREVEAGLAEKYALDNQMLYVETSAWENKGVDHLF